jgi:hypothetical protein
MFLDINNGVKMTKNLFNEQLAKGRPCEIAFREMAHKHWGRDNVYDYTNYEMWKDVQGKGIDFGITSEEWIDEVRVDVKGNFYFSEYNQCLQFDIEYSKWHPSKFNLHNREKEVGWIQDSLSDRIYHFEKIKVNDEWVATGNYLYYDKREMESFIYREWDRPKGKNWIRDLVYIGSEKSDYAELIPVRLDDKRFEHLIRKVHYVETC